MTFVIISGGIDLSVGSTYALAVILSASFAQYGSSVAVAGRRWPCRAGRTGAGADRSRWLRLPPFIVTLAGLTGIRGLVFFITHEGNDHPAIAGLPGVRDARHRQAATIGTPVWIMLIVFAARLVGAQPHRLRAGGPGGRRQRRRGRADGPAGPAHDDDRVRRSAGSAPALSGILTTALSGGGQEARIGDSYELQAIAAVVIGGTLLAGGVGSMIGTLAGVALLFVIQNLIVQGANLNSYVQQVVSGGFLLVVVILQAVVSRRSAAREV